MHQTFRRDDLRNRILTSLAPSDLDAMVPHLESVRLQRGQRIYQPGDHVRRIYFIDSGLIALIKSMHDGRSAMVGTRGPEGCTTPGALFGPNPLNAECIAQIPGDAHAIDLQALRKLMQELPTLEANMRSYGWHMIEHIVQVAACNRLHSLEQRYAKLLLTGYDSVASDSFELTQESLAMNLGVQRSRISVVAGLFQRAKVIEYRHGHIRILDPAALKALACGCYETLRKRTETLFERLTAR